MLPLPLLAIAWAHVPEVFVTNADEDWCAVIDSVAGGDYVMLEPGDYTGPCEVVSKISDPPGEVTIVQSLDPSQPARMIHDGSAPFILSLAGDVGMFLNLDFGEVPAGVVAVELRRGNDLSVRSAIFSGPGTAVKQVADIGILALQDCRYENATGIAFEAGCDGVCSADFIEISNNLVDGGAPRFLVQGGELVAVDNTALGCSSPLFQVDVQHGEVSRNALEGAPPLELAGDVIVHSNVFIGTVNLEGGAFLANTVIGDMEGSPTESAHNAVVAGSPGPADVACDAACFVDLDALDLYPAADGPLVGAGKGLGVETDWCERERAGAEAAGAFAFVGEAGSPGPIEAGFKSRVNCRLPDEAATLDTAGGADTAGSHSGGIGDDSEASESGADEAGAGGCGCLAHGHGGGLGGLGLAAVGAAFGRRRRARTTAEPRGAAIHSYSTGTSAL